MIRVRVIVNKTEGDEIIPGDTPAYNVVSDWTQIGDYLYYNKILTEKNDRDDTTTAAISISADSDTQVLLLAEAIQAAFDASKEGWNATFSNGSWS